MKWIAGKILKQRGQTIADLAEKLKSDNLSYRTIYEYFKRGGGSLKIGAQIAKGMGLTLNDVYVEEDDPRILDQSTPPDNEPLLSFPVPQDYGLLKALVNFDDVNSLRKAALKLGNTDFTAEAEICNNRAKELSDPKETE